MVLPNKLRNRVLPESHSFPSGRSQPLEEQSQSSVKRRETQASKIKAEKY